MRKLNLGAGEEILKDFDNHDIDPREGINLIFDFNKPKFPIKDNTYDYIFCNHSLMYIKDFSNLFNELYRISNNNAIIEILCPHVSSNLGMSIFMHHLFSIISFDEVEGVGGSEFGHGRFKLVKKMILFREKRSSKIMIAISKPINYIFNINGFMQILADRFVSRIIPFYSIYWKIKVIK